METELGITDACRLALKSSDLGLTAIGVRDSLDERGYQMDERYTNSLAVVWSILRRLVKSGEATEENSQLGKIVFKWKVPPRKPGERFHEITRAPGSDHKGPTQPPGFVKKK